MTTPRLDYIDFTGTPPEVLAAVAPLHASGDLVRWDPPITGVDGTVAVRAYVHATPRRPVPLPDHPTPSRTPTPRPGTTWGDVTAVAAAVGGTALLLSAAVFREHLVAVAVVAVGLAAPAAVLVAFLAAVTGGKGCPGLHCSGCKG